MKDIEFLMSISPVYIEDQAILIFKFNLFNTYRLDILLSKSPRSARFFLAILGK